MNNPWCNRGYSGTHPLSGLKELNIKTLNPFRVWNHVKSSTSGCTGGYLYWALSSGYILYYTAIFITTSKYAFKYYKDFRL